MLLDIAYKIIAIISHSRLLRSEEWNIGHLIIIPKKGDFSLSKNYQGIMLPEIAYKIIAIILHSRLLSIGESLDQEPQCEFRSDRGCMDAIFTKKTAIKKHNEHGLESWVLFSILSKLLITFLESCCG